MPTSGTVPPTGSTKTKKNPCLQGAYILTEETAHTYIQIHAEYIHNEYKTV